MDYLNNRLFLIFATTKLYKVEQKIITSTYQCYPALCPAQQQQQLALPPSMWMGIGIELHWISNILRILSLNCCPYLYFRGEILVQPVLKPKQNSCEGEKERTIVLNDRHGEDIKIEHVDKKEQRGRFCGLAISVLILFVAADWWLVGWFVWEKNSFNKSNV